LPPARPPLEPAAPGLPPVAEVAPLGEIAAVDVAGLPAPAAAEAAARHVPAALILGGVLLAGFSSAFNNSLVPPIMPVLMRSFDVSLGTASWLVSIGGILGLVLALPSGVILRRLGPRLAGLVALSFLLAGGVLGAVSGTFGILLAGRAVQGIGMVLMSVSIPAVVAMVYPPEKRGTPMGIVSIWAPLGFIVAFNTAPYLQAAGGWQLVWWLGVGLIGVALAGYFVVVRIPAAMAGGPGTAGWSGPHASLGRLLLTRDIWLLAAAWCAFSATVGSVSNFYTTFLVNERGFAIGFASFLTSLLMALSMLSGVLSGVISDRIGSRKILMVGSLLGMSALMLLPYRVTEPWQAAAFLVSIGLVSGLFPAPAFSSVPEVMGSPRAAAVGMGILTLGQNVAFFAGPPIVGSLIGAIGWSQAALCVMPVGIVGAFCASRVRVK
jgi:MFS family permease